MTFRLQLKEHSVGKILTVCEAFQLANEASNRNWNVLSEKKKS